MATKAAANKQRTWVFNKSADKKTAELLIYDQIGKDWFGDGVSAKDFRKDLKALGNIDSLDVRINSPGGNVFDGQAIYNALRDSKFQVHVHVDGLAASMASVIAMAGDTVTVNEGALMMIHNPHSFAIGDSNEMRRQADLLDKVKDQLITAYEQKTSLSRDEIASLMDAETWMDADEAVSKGFADEITTEQPAIAALWSTDQLPDGFLKSPTVSARLSAFAKDKDMPTTEDNAPAVPNELTRVVATIAELEAIKGADDKFVLAQLKKGATLAEAKDAMSESLYAQVEALQQQVADLQASKPAEAPKAENPAPPVEIKSVGVKPIEAKSVGAHEAPPSWQTTYYAELKKAIDAGEDAVAAGIRIRRENPNLFAA